MPSLGNALGLPFSAALGGSAPPSEEAILMEDGTDILMEDGTPILME
jgi:hypothetical protein